MPAAFPLASLPGFGNPLDAQLPHDWPNVGAQPTVIDPSAGRQRGAEYEWVFAYPNRLGISNLFSFLASQRRG
jgi:hypothetical protein